MEYRTITKGNYSGWTIKVSNEVYVETIEGDRFPRLNWFVAVANPFGDQFRHKHNFMFFESASGFAINVFNKLSKNEAELNLDEHWYQIEAEYGSEAYLAYQEAEDVYNEYENDNFNL
jgi:hypothetical protein